MLTICLAAKARMSLSSGVVSLILKKISCPSHVTTCDTRSSVNEHVVNTHAHIFTP